MASDTFLSSIPGISHNQHLALKKGPSLPSIVLTPSLLYSRVSFFLFSFFFTGGFVTVSDVLLSPLSDISQRCRLAPQAVQAIVDSIARALARPPSILRDVMRNGSELITTGDTVLDKMLGGGIRVGMVWELAGERQVSSHTHTSSLGS